MDTYSSDTYTENNFIVKKNNEVINADVEKSGTYYTISVDGIGASDLSGTYTLTVNGLSEDVFMYTYGVYGYCHDAQEMNVEDYPACTDKLKTLCKAIYTYGEAARIYAASLNQQ